MTDLATKEGVDEFVAYWMTKTVDEFAENGSVRPHAVVFGTLSPDGDPLGLAAPHFLIDADGGMTKTPETKSAFVATVRDYSRRTRAVGVMMVMEVWMRTMSSQDEVGQYRHGDLAKDPQRREAIFITLDHLAHAQTKAWFAPIEREANGKGRVGAFILTPCGLSGRFTEVFPRELYQ
jgi:hypothetical protein